MTENELNKNIHLLFPTVIYREENFLPKHVVKKYKKLILNDTCENGGKTWLSKIRNSNKTHDLSTDPNFQELHEKINDRIQFLSSAMKFNRKLNCQGSWFNIYKKYDYQEVHHHGDTVLSCVYFVKSNEKSSFLVLYNPTEIFDGNIGYTEGNELNWSNYKIPPIKNSLVIFRSYLKHCVAQHMDKSLRITISGNYM